MSCNDQLIYPQYDDTETPIVGPREDSVTLTCTRYSVMGTPRSILRPCQVISSVEDLLKWKIWNQKGPTKGTSVYIDIHDIYSRLPINYAIFTQISSLMPGF